MTHRVSPPQRSLRLSSLPPSAAVVAAAAPSCPSRQPRASWGSAPRRKIGLLADAGKKTGKGAKDKAAAKESSHDFEARATQADAIQSAGPAPVATPDGSAAELQGEAAEAIALYEKLLAKYPHYERNDQVLYQLSRAYDEAGATEKAMSVMGRIVKEHASSRYFDEVQFRNGEYHFTRKKWLDAEEAYKSVADKGAASAYYELALYKLGWTFYKQDMTRSRCTDTWRCSTTRSSTGYDFDKRTRQDGERRVEDTYRAISLGFSNLGGSEAVKQYFAKYGRRTYEDRVYGNLAEHYLDKLRYSDAAATYKAFVKRSSHITRSAPHYACASSRSTSAVDSPSS